MKESLQNSTPTAFGCLRGQKVVHTSSGRTNAKLLDEIDDAFCFFCAWCVRPLATFQAFGQRFWITSQITPSTGVVMSSPSFCALILPKPLPASDFLHSLLFMNALLNSSFIFVVISLSLLLAQVSLSCLKAGKWQSAATCGKPQKTQICVEGLRRVLKSARPNQRCDSVEKHPHLQTTPTRSCKRTNPRPGSVK